MSEPEVKKDESAGCFLTCACLCGLILIGLILGSFAWILFGLGWRLVFGPPQ